MTALSNTKLNDEIRAHYMTSIRSLLETMGEETLSTASNEITIPCLDSVGNDKFLTIKFVIPKGSKDEPYDGYEVANSYKMHTEEMAQKKADAKAKADAKKKKDAERRAKAKENKEKNSEK